MAEHRTENKRDCVPHRGGPQDIRTRPVGLSGRLRAISELAGSGRTVCDVGCDHAHIPIRLLQEKRFSRAIGMDVIDGPLGKAAGNLRLYGMEQLVDLRLSDGLDAYSPGEADTLIIAGMGGSMISDILLREPEKTESFDALVLGPQSDPDKVRRCLRTLGFRIEEERLLYEDGKYYPILRAVRGRPRCAAPCTEAKHAVPEAPESLVSEAETCFMEKDARKSDRFAKSWISEDLTGPVSAGTGRMLWEREIPEDICQAAEDLFGPVLLQRRDPVLHEYLIRQTAVLEKILRSVRGAVLQTAPDGGDVSASAPVKARLQMQDPEDGGEVRMTGKSAGKRESLYRAHLTRQAQIERELEIFRTALNLYRQTAGTDCRDI